jgi:hypothetical protein
MGLAKGRIELCSAFRQLHLAFADVFEIRPYFLNGKLWKWGWRKAEWGSIRPFASLIFFFHLGNKALFCPMPASFPS